MVETPKMGGGAALRFILALATVKVRLICTERGAVYDPAAMPPMILDMLTRALELESKTLGARIKL